MSPHQNPPIVPIPNGVPSSFYAGDTVDFIVSDGRYTPAKGWEVTVYFSGESKINGVGVPATEASSSWEITLTPTKTALLKPGPYQWQAIAVSGSEQRSFDASGVKVKPSARDSAAGSLVTFSQRKLQQLEAAIEYRLSGEGGVDKMVIEGQDVTHIDIDKLNAMRAEAYREVQAEQFGKNSLPTIIEIEFRSP